MQLGMIGLGRMGANMVRRLMRDGHTCVVYDRSPQAVEALVKDKATGASSLADFVKKLDKPRALCLMVPAAFVDSSIDELVPLLEKGDTIIDGGNSHYQDDIARAKRLAQKGIHYVDMGTSGGVWGLERGYCLMIGGEKEVVKRLDPIFKTLAPGRGDVRPCPGREKQGRHRRARATSTAAPAGAGHFVKMIHNGIEYGLMAAYGEGLNILKNADIGKASASHEKDAETTPLRNPEHYQYDFDLADITELWRRGSVVTSWLLDLTAQALATDPDLEKFGGKVSDSGEGRWTVAGRQRRGRAGPRADRLAVRALRLARPGRLPEPRALRHALRLRRARGEEVTEEQAALRRPGLLRRHRRPRLQEDLPRAAGDGPAGQAGLPRGRAWPSRAGTREQLVERAKASVTEYGGGVDPEAFPKLVERLQLRGRRLRRPRHVHAAPGRAGGREASRTHYLAIPPSLFRGGGQEPAESGCAENARVVVEKPFGRDLASARELNQVITRYFPEEQHLPHRPLPREGAGPEHPVLPLRQRVPGADLEPPLRRERPDHDGGELRREGPREVLRGDRGHPRRDPEPPAADRELPGHGGPLQHVPRGHPRRAGQGAAHGAAHEHRQHGARPVPRLPRRARRVQGLVHGHLRGPAPLRGLLALGGRAVLRARRARA